MKVTVEMTSEEFNEFLNWKKEQDYYQNKIEKANRNVVTLAKKVEYAIEPDPKKPNKFKIADNEHADDLYMMAGEILDAGGP